MPQIFQVLRCYKCLVFQVHQTKKSNKFDCKLCGEKQSIKRHYGIGTAKDCRMHVQKLNGIRGEIEELKKSKGSNSDEENIANNQVVRSYPQTTQLKQSKWSDYVDNKEVEGTQQVSESETMYLDNTEVVLERPKKRRKHSFRCPNVNKTTETTDYIESTSDSDQTKSSYGNTCTKPLEYCKDTNYQDLKIDVNNYIPPKITVKKVVKEFVPPTTTTIATHNSPPPKLHGNSKWAQFVDEENEDVSDDEDLCLNKADYRAFNVSHSYEESVSKDDLLNNSSYNSQALFALCDDSELDNVLDI